MLDKIIAERLSNTLDRPVTIGSVERADSFSLHPVLAIRDVTIPQPDWVKQSQPMAHVDTLRIGFDSLTLLWSGLKLERLDVDGAQALLIRNADRRTNWSGSEKSKGGSGGSLSLDTLSLIDLKNVAIDYRDAVQQREFAVTLSGSSAKGLRVAGTGKVRGNAVKVTASGARFDEQDSKGRWPFALAIDGDSLGFDAKGTMAAPLRFDDSVMQIRARGADLRDIDALIEAGLPGTQPVKMAATVEHNGNRWRIAALRGTVGRSDFTGKATIEKRDGHTQIDGSISASQFDFADLSTDAGEARAKAKEARIGKRVIPDTAIDLSHLGNTDGTLHIHADRLLWPGSKPFRALDATLTLDDRTLTISPLRFAMPRGVLSGSATVTQKDAGPQLHLQLTLKGAQLSDLFPATGIDAKASGKVDLTGMGNTIRAAIGTANGRATLVARNGSLPDRTALLLGQDAGGLFSGKKKQAQLRCLIAPFVFQSGTARAQSVLIDTNRAVTRAAGTISFPSEKLNLALHGVAKQGSTLRIGGAIPVGGTISAPDVGRPAKGDTVGDIIGQVGKAIFGSGEPRAPDTDCEAEIAKALAF